MANLSSATLKRKKKHEKKKETMAISGLMHICHARRKEGPDGHDTVAGVLTNVCGRPVLLFISG